MAPSTPTPSLPTGTALSFVSGETNQPVASAAVTVAGRAYTTSLGGEITLATEVPLQSSLAVVAPGFLERQTLLRSTGSTRFTLWPKTSPTGLSESITEAIVYTANFCPFDPGRLGQAPLSRLVPGTTQVFVVPSVEIASDSAAAAGVERGVAVMNAATHGAVIYAVVPQAPTGSVAFGLTIDGQNRACQSFGALGATTLPNISSSGITGGTIAFCSSLALRAHMLVAHELGHTFGLHHSSELGDVMFCSGTPSQSFTPREQLLMALSLQRPHGNRFPDDDRGAIVASSAARTTEVTICGFAPGA